MKVWYSNVYWLKLIGIATLLTLNNAQLHAQETKDCYEVIITANKLYEAGHFQDALNLLTPCSGKELRRRDRFEIHRIMALCCLYLHNDSNTSYHVKQLLLYRPDYQIFPYSDPADLTKVIQRYSVAPLLEAGIKTGINFNFIRENKNYSLTNSTSSYVTKTGHQSGIFIRYHLKSKWSFGCEVLYEGLNLEQHVSNVSGWDQVYKENLNYFNVPLLVGCSFPERKRFTIQTQVGIQTQFLNRAQGSIILSDESSDIKQINTIDRMGQRASVLWSVMAGADVLYRTKTGSFGFDIRYAFGLSNMVKPDERYSSLIFSLNNQYLDSDKTLNPLYLSFSYRHTVKYSVK